MDYVIERTHIIDHERFLEAGAVARDLWEWGMKYSGKHELDGAIPMTAVLASPWGYGGKGNAKAAAKLVEVGLWARTDKGFMVLKWTEMGNKTRAQMEITREAERKKKAAQRKRSVPPQEQCPAGTTEGTPQGTPAGVLNSPSPSTSLSGSDQGGAGGTRALRPDEPLTEQRRKDFAGLTFTVPDRPIDPEWRNFVDDRISRSTLFASDSAIDADWRKWVRRQNGFEASRRQQVRDRGGGTRGDRQPGDRGWIDRMKKTGTEDES